MNLDGINSRLINLHPAVARYNLKHDPAPLKFPGINLKSGKTSKTA